MASNTVGINISMQSNIPQVAKQSADALRNMSNASADMQKALSLGGIEGQYKEFADRINKYHDSLKRMQETQRQTGVNLPSLANAGSLFRSTGGAVAGLGATGDIVNAGAGVGETLGSMLKGLGPIAGAAGGALLGGAGLAFGANALEKVYEKQINTVMKVTAQLDKLGNTGAQTSKNFGKVMDDVTEKAAKMGMTFEQGAAIFGALATAGGRGAAVGRAASDVMKYARVYGADTGTLSQFMGLGLRFGLTGGGSAGIMGYAANQIQNLGMSKGQLGEVIQAQTQMIESALSRGIIKNVPGVSGVQAWLGGMGKQYQGQYGLNVFNKMDTAIAGATGVQSQADIIKYQAASQVLGGKGTYIDVMKQLEAGATAENINAIKNTIKGITGDNKNNAIELIRQVYGVNYTTAEKIWRAPNATIAKKAYDEASGKAKGLEETPEMKLMKEQNQIMGSIRDLAKELTPMKAGIYEGADRIIGTLEKLFGIGKAGEQTRKDREERNKRLNETEEVRKATLNPNIGWGSSNSDLAAYAGIRQLVADKQSGNAATKVLNDFWSGLSTTQQNYTTKNNLFGFALREATSPTSEGGTRITLGELAIAISNLTSMLSDLTDATKDNTKVVGAPLTVKTKRSAFGEHSYNRVH